MTTSMVRGARSVHNGAPLLSIGALSKRWGAHPNSIREWVRRGELPAIILPSGHRRFRLEDCLEFFEGISLDEQEREDGKVPIAQVCRVSTDKQARGLAKGKESDFTRQLDKCREYIQERWGSSADITEYNRVASGMNFSEPVLVRLIDDLLAGKFRGGYVVARTPERIARFALNLIRLIAEKGGAELVFCGSGQEEKEEYESLSDDILAVVTHFAAVTHGRRSAETCRREFSSECIARMIELRKQNWSLKDIVDQLNKEGFRTSKDTPISRWLVMKYLDKNGTEKALTVASGLKRGSSLLGQWKKECVELTEDKEETILVGDAYKLYARYCRQRGCKAETEARFGRLLTDVPRGRRGKNRDRIYVGVKINSEV